MNIEEVREYALSLPMATEDMPYGPDWLIFRIGGKIFLHIWLESPEPTCAVKLPPEEGEELRESMGGAVRPAYHLNKTHWSDLMLEQVDDDVVSRLIRESYGAVCSRLPRKVRSQMGLI